MAERNSQGVETPDTRILRDLAELLRFHIEATSRPCCLKILSTEKEAHARTREELEAEKRAHMTTKTEKDGEIRRHTATITTIKGELEAEKRAHTTTKAEKDGEIRRHMATITTIKGELEAEKRAHTTTKTEKDGEIRRHTATITTIKGELEAEKRAHATTKTEKDGEIRRHMATITTIEGELEAEKEAHTTTKAEWDAEKLAHAETGRDVVRGMSEELNEIDDDELKDMGVETEDVESGAEEVVEGKTGAVVKTKKGEAKKKSTQLHAGEVTQPMNMTTKRNEEEAKVTRKRSAQIETKKPSRGWNLLR